MKKRLLICLGIFFQLSPLFAHPGTGIVRDRKGALYYTDLSKVWKISPDGRKKVVLRNVHTHELFLDQEDNLYGEHLSLTNEVRVRLVDSKPARSLFPGSVSLLGTILCMILFVSWKARFRIF